MKNDLSGIAYDTRPKIYFELHKEIDILGPYQMANKVWNELANKIKPKVTIGVRDKVSAHISRTVKEYI